MCYQFFRTSMELAVTEDKPKIRSPFLPLNVLLSCNKLSPFPVTIACSLQNGASTEWRKEAFQPIL